MIGFRRLRLSIPNHMLLPGLLLLLVVATPFLASVITDADPVKLSVRERFALPSLEHPLGQDEFGRDRLARVLHGGQVSLLVALTATGLASLVGVLFGLVGAYFRGAFEFVTGRLADIVLCSPPILLALLMVTLFGPGAATLIAALSVLYFPIFARIAYSECLRVSALDFVEASRALGTPSRRIIVRTILPNIAGPLAIQYSLTVAAAITIESGLSFLGLGVVPPAPSWGQMIRGARGSMEQDPLGIVIPCVALTLTILAINLFCDRLRDSLDPRSPIRENVGSARRTGATLERAGDRTLAPGVSASIAGLRLETGATSSPVVLVEDVSLQLEEGRCVALVGESGSGKSLSSLALMALLPDAIRRSSGSLTLRAESEKTVAIESMSERSMETIRGNDVAMVFQDPMTSLNPLLTVGDQIEEAVRAHRPIDKGSARSKAVDLLRKVGINEAERRLGSYPHQMSGGMRQRVMIAIALASEPRVLVADEPTTALDVTIQAEIVELLGSLRRDDARRLAMLFISHNLGVVSQIADRVVVMYSGRIVEDGPAEIVLAAPRHPYTRALIASMPSSHEDLHSSRGDRLTTIGGAPPLPSARPSGCTFRDRCPIALPECGRTRPELAAVSGHLHRVRCLRSEELAA